MPKYFEYTSAFASWKLRNASENTLKSQMVIFVFLGTADVLLPWNVSVNLHWQHKITHKNSFKLLHLDFNEHFWIKPFKNTFAQRYIKWTHFNDFLSLRIYAVQCKKTHTLLQKNNAYFECKQTPRPKFIGLRNRNAEHYNMNDFYH